MAQKWMTQDANEWTTRTMHNFINDQYDGTKASGRHAAKLADFAYMDNAEQRAKFAKVYNKYYEADVA